MCIREDSLLTGIEDYHNIVKHLFWRQKTLKSHKIYCTPYHRWGRTNHLKISCQATWMSHWGMFGWKSCPSSPHRKIPNIIDRKCKAMSRGVANGGIWRSEPPPPSIGSIFLVIFNRIRTKWDSGEYLQHFRLQNSLLKPFLAT